jgi:hypothetical protein
VNTEKYIGLDVTGSLLSRMIESHFAGKTTHGAVSRRS